MNRELLEKEFDASLLKTKIGTFGSEITYIEGSAVIARLNNAFSGIWSFEVSEYKVLEDEIIVLGKLTAEGITKSQFGSNKITRNKETKEPVSLGGDLKSAGTDALKKCATLFGVGLYLYGSTGNGANKADSNGSTKANGGGNGKGNNNGQGNGNGNGNGDLRLTNKQLQTIYSIGKDKGLSQKQIKDHCLEVFNKVPDFLTKPEASTIIKELLEK